MISLIQNFSIMNTIKVNLLSALVLFFIMTLIYSCGNDTNAKDLYTETLSDTDSAALLFMLEEEKLARDTYAYLDNLWSLNQFSNIKLSEQSHMNAVENLLKVNNISYTILPSGEFADAGLQTYYNQFTIDGAIDQVHALQVGATIEDLDIVDLQEYIDVTSNTALISVFESLQCGSRNHLRSFVNTIANLGASYTPQFLTEEAYDAILNSSQEQCN